MQLTLKKLDFMFSKPPLVIGGWAMEYYGLRKCGADIDLVAPAADIEQLARRYPHRIKDLWGDLGVCPFDFEIWKSICLFDYDYLSEGAEDIGEVLLITLEKLLFTRLLMRKQRYTDDAKLIVERILTDKYADFEVARAENIRLLGEIPAISFIQKTGPSDKLSSRK